MRVLDLVMNIKLNNRNMSNRGKIMVTTFNNNSNNNNKEEEWNKIVFNNKKKRIVNKKKKISGICNLNHRIKLNNSINPLKYQNSTSHIKTNHKKNTNQTKNKNSMQYKHGNKPHQAQNNDYHPTIALS